MEYMKKDFEKNVEKIFENLAQGRRIQTDSMKSWDNFANYDHKSEDMDYIESDKINLAYLISSCCLETGWGYLSQIRSEWEMDSS